MSEILEQQPLLLWDNGTAKYPISQDKHGQLYRTPVSFLEKKHIGVPGKVYTEWGDWYYDFLKLSLRVRGSCLDMPHEAYARFRYETCLRNMVGVEGDERMNIECQILQELYAEVSS